MSYAYMSQLCLRVSAQRGILQELVIVGGLEMQQQAKALARRPHVVVATPGRLKVFKQSMRQSSHNNANFHAHHSITVLAL